MFQLEKPAVLFLDAHDSAQVSNGQSQLSLALASFWRLLLFLLEQWPFFEFYVCLKRDRHVSSGRRVDKPAQASSCRWLGSRGSAALPATAPRAGAGCKAGWALGEGSRERFRFWGSFCLTRSGEGPSGYRVWEMKPSGFPSNLPGFPQRKP